MHYNTHDLTGRRFNRLTVLSYADDPRPGAYWWCRCDCGKIKKLRASAFVGGLVKSCGCMMGHPKHGKTGTPEHTAWTSMKTRCYRPANSNYRIYGGRGITVCERWLHSFENFYADMGPRPSPQHSLDRIDNDGNYKPGNCRWATVSQQGRNTRVNNWVEFQGAKKTVTEWAELTGINKQTLYARIRQGWTPEQAFTIPADGTNRKRSPKPS